MGRIFVQSVPVCSTSRVSDNYFFSNKYAAMSEKFNLSESPPPTSKSEIRAQEISRSAQAHHTEDEEAPE